MRILIKKPEGWDGKHVLMCYQGLNSNSGYHYCMYCNVLKEMGDGRLKIKVFGTRFRRSEGEKIRYVESDRIALYSDYYKDDE